MKAIPGEFQHALVVADVDMKKVRNVVRKTSSEGREINLMKDVKMGKQGEGGNVLEERSCV